MKETIKTTSMNLDYNKREITRKCHHCGFITNKNLRFCPPCQQKDLIILLSPMIKE